MPKQKKESVLIIKTGHSEVLHNEYDSRKTSLGDVLRTTPILHLFRNSAVTWATDEKAFPLLIGNPYINQLLALDWITAEQLKEERFDTVINLEKVPGLCVLADKIKAWKRFGYRSDIPQGRVTAEAYEHASRALSLSLDDRLKQQNEKTIQELLFEMLGKKWDGEEYILGYKPKSREIYDVGLNSQIGTKWPTKAWPAKNWPLLERLLTEQGLKASLDETTLVEGIGATQGDLYTYMDWINSSRLVISNDSLGLHIGIALGKKVVGLFGSTSSKEVCFYGRGEAILPEKQFDCLPCFLPSCSKKEFCLDYITPESVCARVVDILNS